MDERDHTVLQVDEASAGKRNKHLVFALGDETFGIPLSQVKEVIGMVAITPVPNVPAYFKGIINLRGRIISVLDLKAKMGVAQRKNDTKRPCILICEFGQIVLGSIVDDALAVIGFEESQIETFVDLQSCASRDHIIGVAKSRETGLTLLLDIGKVLNIDEIEMLRSQTKAAAA